LRAPGEVKWPGAPRGNLATDFVVTKASLLEAKATRSWLDSHGSAAPKDQALVFVQLQQPLQATPFFASQFVHDSDTGVTPILFTWPSRGSLFAYGYDRESAALSRDALEQLLNSLMRDPAIEKADILAHSMGNFLVL
jgi:esterase/lipase superfamily enzyme